LGLKIQFKIIQRGERIKQLLQLKDNIFL